MFLKSLKLQNIRSYVEETVKFPPGSCLLAGDIGAGKSTILLAIEFALFGTKRGELMASSLLRNGTHAGHIELNMELRGKDVTISRTLKRTPTSIKQDAGHIVLGNERQDGTTTELRAKMIDLLGYPKGALTKKDLLYRYTVFTPQEEMRKILYDDTEARLNTLRKVFHIDKYKRMKVNAQFIAKEMRTQSRILGEAMQGVEMLEAKKKELGDTCATYAVTCNNEKPLLIAMQEKRRVIEKHILALDGKQKELQELKKKEALLIAESHQLLEQQKQRDIKTELLDKEIGALHIRIKKELVCPSADKKLLQEKIGALQKEIQETKERKSVLSQKKTGLEEKQTYIAQELKQLTEAVEHKAIYEEQISALDAQLEQREGVQVKIGEQNARLLSLTKELVACDVQTQQADSIVERLAGLEKCTLCLQDVAHEHKEHILKVQRTALAGAGALRMQLDQQKEEVRKLLEDWKGKEKDIIVAEKKRAVVQNVLHSVLEKEAEKKQKESLLLVVAQEINDIAAQTILSQDLGTQEKELTQHKEILEKYFDWEKAIIERRNIELLIADKKKQKEQHRQEKEVLFKKLQEISEEKRLILKQLEQHIGIEKQYLTEKQKLRTAVDEEKRKEITIISLEKDVQSIREQLVLVTKEIEEKKKTGKKVKKLRVYAHWIDDFFVPLVGTMEKQVMFQVHANFNTLFTSWFTILMDDENINTRLDEDFCPIVEQNGYETTLLDLSGGEKTAVALAYRLALNKVINDFVSTIHTSDLLILDEPTDGFSAQQLDKVREVLDELDMKQVILVSHENKIESFVEHVLRVEKTGHVSKVHSSI